MLVSGNTVYAPGGVLGRVCGNHTLTQWVAAGHDKGTSRHDMPSDDALVAMGRELLGIDPK